LVHISKDGVWEIDPLSLRNACDIVFIAMHGEYGEDGVVQGLLEAVHIPYTGSGVLASALGMDKYLSLQIFQHAGLLVPKTILVEPHSYDSDRIEDMLGLPLVVKPRGCGSSVGVSIVRSLEQLPSAIINAGRFHPGVLVQQYIEGTEVTCGVVDRGTTESAIPLVPTEIIPQTSEFFDYEAKYTPGASREITPPRLPQEVQKQIQGAALVAHKVLGCRGISRSDFIVDREGKLWILEINTLPGLTKTSLVPQEAEAMGISFEDLLDMIIEAGFQRK
jgi:D-alanine-D-alanine ligase